VSTYLRCDGCGAELSAKRPRVIRGERADGMRGGSHLPDGKFDWCMACTVVAFTAVASRHEPAAAVNVAH
jgi:hypothetical protein